MFASFDKSARNWAKYAFLNILQLMFEISHTESIKKFPEIAPPHPTSLPYT
jgi:hypothetical protein